MPQARDEPLIKVTINLYERDYEWLFRQVGEGRVGDTIRKIIRQWRVKQEAINAE